MGKTSFSLIILFILFIASTSAAPIYDVVKFGSRPDGKTDCTQSFLSAWIAACRSFEPATVYVPPGQFLLKNIAFEGQCNNSNIIFRIDGNLVAPFDYNVIGNSENWISFEWVTGVSIYGGILDGRGASLWACKAANKKCPEGTTSLRFTNSNNIVINGLKSFNSQIFHIVVNRCENVYFQGVLITAPGNSPNTDGIHVQLSTNVTIMKSGIKTGDDCISIGPGTKNLWIQNIACGPGHGISIGSLAKEFDEEGVENVTVKTAVFTGTTNGLRIKAWRRLSKGFVKGVLFQHVTMKNAENPIVIDQNYCPRNENCPTQESGVQISQVTYRDIKGTSATKVAVKFDCSDRNPCSQIRLQDVKLTYKNQIALSSCANAAGSSHGFVQPESCL